MTAIVAYIPVLHEGYRRLFEKHPDAKELYIFGNDVIASYAHLVKDIRKLDPELVQKSITAWGIFDSVKILDAVSIETLQKNTTALIVSDDDLSTELAAKYFPNNPVTKDTIFLRWDKKKSIEPAAVSPDVEISEMDFDIEMINLSLEEGMLSRDWWRRIGALVVKDGTILMRAHNIYVPSEQIANDEGDPRGNFSAGEHFESSLALHAEAGLVAQAAKEGISLQGTDVYCDTFPCPPCAKQLAYAGISTLYYRNGYAVLDGERILKSQGVKIVFVK
ncbi:MAG: deaminase [Candidatus Uhrbacteria bacterium]